MSSWFGRKGAQDFEIAKAWPPSIAQCSAGSILTFGIPLRSRRTCTNWSIVSELLQQTLTSILRQSDPRFRVIVCGHEFPDLPQLSDERVELVRATWPSPRQSDYNRDKHLKRVVMGLRLRQLGGGHFMQVDADDLVHVDIVMTALDPTHKHGSIAPLGYVYDYSNRIIAPVPGAWPVELDRVCGSTAIVFYTPEEIPEAVPRKLNVSSLRRTHKFVDDSTHTSVWQASAEYGRPLVPLPFPSVIYVMNTTENISSMRSRSGLRAPHIPQMIAAHRITSREKLIEIDAAFGTSFAEATLSSKSLRDIASS